MKIYISGALKGSHDLNAARALYERAGDVIKSCGHEAYIPHQNTDPQRAADVIPTSVFNIDIAAMRAADGVVAFLNEPSLGVGAEIAICVQENIPVLALYQRGTDVSRFILGCLNVNGGQAREYNDWPDAERAIEFFLLNQLAEATKTQVGESGLAESQPSPKRQRA